MSISAISCPSVTTELKSAYNFATIPVTCVPTSTCVMHSSVPVAVTASVISPRATVAVCRLTFSFFEQAEASNSSDTAAAMHIPGTSMLYSFIFIEVY